MQHEERSIYSHSDNEINNEFNNLESVEAIYPAESIEIIDCVSAQFINSGQVVTEPEQHAANDANAPGHIYSMDNARMIKQSRSQERRACKSRLTDRRSEQRLNAAGEEQADRRDANRQLNINAIRQTLSNDLQCSEPQ